MKRREIYCPKFCAAYFLLVGLFDFLTIAIELLGCFFVSKNPIDPLGIVGKVITGAAALFISIVLFKKRYDKMLISAMCGLILSKLITGLVGSKFFSVAEADYIFTIAFSVIVDVLLLFVALAFVRNSEKEKDFVTKTRYVVPVLYIVSLVIQGVFIVTEALKQMGDDETLVIPTVIVTMISFVPAAVLAAINYFKLVGWLIEPYDKIKEIKKKGGVSR